MNSRFLWILDIIKTLIPPACVKYRIPLFTSFLILFYYWKEEFYTPGGFRFYLDLSITHVCNKRCFFCSQKIHTSDFKHLTQKEYEHILSCIQSPSEIRGITISGGEPLCHPKFNSLMRQMLNDFPNARIYVVTNGKLLSKVPKGLFDRLLFGISEYPSWNDNIIKKYRRFPNVRVKKFIGFWDPNKNPNLSKEQAKIIRQICNQFQIKLVGTKLYDCCMVESIERKYLAEPIYIEFDKNWKENIYKLETWKACRYCFIAYNIAKYQTRYPPKALIFDHSAKKKLKEII